MELVFSARLGNMSDESRSSYPTCTSKLEVVGNFARQLLKSVLGDGSSDAGTFLGP